MAGELDPQALQQLTVLRRKDIQKQRLGEYEEAVVNLKSKVRDAEGQAMRETVQDKVSLVFFLKCAFLQNGMSPLRVSVRALLCNCRLLPCLSVVYQLECGTGVCAFTPVLSGSEHTGASVSGITWQP